MLNSYLKIAWRNLTRNLRYVVINVLGLGFGLGFGILTFQNYRYANSYDSWHINHDRIVRIESQKVDNDARYGYCPSRLAIDAQQQLVNVATAVRFDSRRAVVKHGNDVFNEAIHFADVTLLQVFDFTLLSGSADFSDPDKVIISKETALKYFGYQNPIGQTLTLYADQPTKKVLMVSGVMDGQYKHSSLRFNFLTHLDNQLDSNKPIDYTDWKYRVDAVFLLLKQSTDVATVEATLAPFIARQQAADPDGKVKRFIAEPLQTLALNARDLRSNALYPSLPPAAVWGTLTMTLLIILTAALNFANMTIAICNRRLKEMGVRKVMGSSQWQLIVQLLTEAGVICGLAILLGMALAYPIADWYNQMWPYMDIVIDYHDPVLITYLIGLLLFVTLLAGAYPAFYVSAFRPTHIFRGALRFGGSGLFSRIMMGMQVAISLIALVTGLSFERNAHYNRTADVGYDRHNLIGAFVYDESSWQVFRKAAQSIPHVEAVSGSQHVPGFSYAMTNFSLNSQPHETMLYNVADDFTTIFQMQLRDGQPLLPLRGDQPAQTVLVNETFVREFGEGQSLVGQSIRMDSTTYRISGIVQDFMTNTPFRPISPAIIRPVPPSRFSYFVARVKASEQKQVLANLEKTWKHLFPDKPFDGFYVDNALAEAEDVSNNIAQTMGVLALVTVLMAVSGLFSLVSLNVVKRIREVAIRRVLGATGTQIGWILHKNYVWILAIAISAGCIGGYFLAMLLMNNIFKLNNGVSMSILVVAALSVLTVAVLTILLKLWQTLKINPANSLKSD